MSSQNSPSVPRPARADAKKTLVLGLFAIAMGYVEAAVVVYLRRIYYPQGFAFPLNNAVLDRMFLVEPGRELATIVMLTTIAILVGRKRVERVGWFLFCFATWDVFYYVWLKALLHWPPSLLTWDILFLIPFPWAAPVLSPALVAASMAVWGLVLVRLDRVRTSPAPASRRMADADTGRTGDSRLILERLRSGRNAQFRPRSAGRGSCSVQLPLVAARRWPGIALGRVPDHHQRARELSRLLSSVRGTRHGHSQETPQ